MLTPISRIDQHNFDNFPLTHAMFARPKKASSMSPRRFLQRHLSANESIRNHRFVNWIGGRLHDQEVWHFGRRSVAGGVSLGFFLAFMPVPIQILIAIGCAFLLRVNLPVALASVWLTNPITFVPMMVFAYQVGGWITGTELSASGLLDDPSIHAFMNLVGEIWYPLLVGCFICGTAAAAIGNVAVRWLWWFYTMRRWRRRRRKSGS